MDQIFIDKCQKILLSLENKLKKIPTECLTNTPKRVREQRSRQKKIDEINDEIKFYKNLIEAEKNRKLRYCKKHFINPLYKGKLYDYLKNPTDYNKSKLLDLNFSLNGIELITREYMKYTKDILTEDEIRRNKIRDARLKYGLYQSGDTHFTPESLVEKIIDYLDIKDTDKCLEPSAGIGNIAEQLKRYSNDVTVCEINYEFCEVLKLLDLDVIQCNFLNNNITGRLFNKIGMNPPFSNNQDIKHIMKAYELLDENGRLAAVLSSHCLHCNDKLSCEFREWLEDKLIHAEKCYDKFDRTNTSCILIVLEKSTDDCTQFYSIKDLLK